MRHVISLLLIAFCLTGCIIDRGSYVPAPRQDSTPQNLAAVVDEEQVRTMISRFGPLLY
jgi:PBP1b-binding outer membrane lipoprotein LpoB